jgi:hypothetical protein
MIPITASETFVYGGTDAAVAIIPRCSEKMAFNVPAAYDVFVRL